MASVRKQALHSVEGSKIEFQGELKLPFCIRCATDGSEVWIRNYIIGNPEHRCVGNIETFETKLQSLGFSDWKFSENGQIEILIPVGSQCIAPQIAKCKGSWIDEGRGVEPFSRGGIGDFRVPYQIRSLRSSNSCPSK